MSDQRPSAIRSAELPGFCERMDTIVKVSREQELPPKLKRFVRIYTAGLPLDATVRYYPKSDFDGIRTRVEELTGGKEKREVWIGVALSNGIGRTDVTQTLIREINSVGDLLARRDIIDGWPAGSWVKVFYETPRQMDCATVSLSSDPVQDSQEAELNFWSNYYDLRIAMSNPPDWRLFAKPESNFAWRHLGGSYPTLEEGRVLRRVFGHDGSHRQAMVRIANMEDTPLVVFEFKMLPNEEFFIDYEVGEGRETECRASFSGCLYDWFYCNG